MAYTILFGLRGELKTPSREPFNEEIITRNSCNRIELERDNSTRVSPSGWSPVEISERKSTIRFYLRVISIVKCTSGE